MKTEMVNVQIKARWWVPIYLNTMVLLCKSMCTQPDEVKMADFLVRHAFVVKVVR